VRKAATIKLTHYPGPNRVDLSQPAESHWKGIQRTNEGSPARWKLKETANRPAAT